MTCDEFEAAFLDYLQGDVDARLTMEVDAHRESCPACQGWVSASMVAASTWTDASASPSADFVRGVMLRIAIESPIPVQIDLSRAKPLLRRPRKPLWTSMTHYGIALCVMVLIMNTGLVQNLQLHLVAHSPQYPHVLGWIARTLFGRI